jgi:RNA polymerase sigma-70 factor (ECF subfamily)
MSKEKELSLKDLGIRFKETRSEKAFVQLYHRIRPGLYNYVYQIVKDSDMTNHIVSAVMTSVHDKIDKYDPKWHISTWIYRIGYTHACGAIRSKKAQKTTPLSYFEGGENKNAVSKIEYDSIDDYRDSMEIQEDETTQTEENLHLRKIVNDLPEEYRTVITEKFFNDLKYDEIAKKLEIPLHTVKNRISRGKRLIKEKLS